MISISRHIVLGLSMKIQWRITIHHEISVLTGLTKFFFYIPGESLKAFYILNYLSKHSIYRPWHLLKNQGFNKKKNLKGPEQIFSRTQIMWQRSDLLGDRAYLSRPTFSIYVRNWLFNLYDHLQIWARLLLKKHKIYNNNVAGKTQKLLKVLQSEFFYSRSPSVGLALMSVFWGKSLPLLYFHVGK